jgi:hypothetical protein
VHLKIWQYLLNLLKAPAKAVPLIVRLT